MIGVLTHHWGEPDRGEGARKLLERNGVAPSRAPGFGNRHTLYSLSDPA